MAVAGRSGDTQRREGDLRSRSRRFLATAAGLLLLPAGCSVLDDAGGGDPSKVAVSDILLRSGATHRAVQTLRAKGWLQDFRQDATRTVPISWDYARPDRCRLQIDMDVAIVAGREWWTYDGKAGRYRKHDQFTRAPIETAAYLMSKGIPFLLPSLLTRGERAFEGGRPGAAGRWELQGVGWYAELPCYVLVRRGFDPGADELLRVWIDQDKALLRGWMVSVPAREGRERPLLECTYSELSANGPLPSDWLQLRPPTPIRLSANP